jgi:hypothetical protein
MCGVTRRQVPGAHMPSPRARRACTCLPQIRLGAPGMAETSVAAMQALYTGEFLLVQCMKCIDITLRAAGPGTLASVRASSCCARA